MSARVTLGRLNAAAEWWRLASSLGFALRPARLMPLCVVALAVAAPMLGAAFLWCAGQFVDRILVDRAIVALPWIATAFVCIGIVRALVGYADERLDAWVSEGLVQTLRIALYRHILGASPGSLGRHKVGDLLARLSTDVERSAIVLYSGPLAVLENATRILCYGAFLLFLSWKLGLIALIVVPPLTWCVARFAPLVRRAAAIARRKAAGWMTIAEERLGALETVQALRTEAIEVERMTRFSATARRAELRAVALQAMLGLLVNVLSNAGALLVMLFAAFAVLEGAMSAGAVIAFLAAIWSLYDPMQSLSQALARIERGKASAHRVVQLLTMSSLVQEQVGARHLITARPALVLRNVSFAYPGGRKVLDNVSLDVPFGQTLALVGASGSGKSTIARMLVRLYDPDSGSVMLGGHDIRTMRLDALRHTIALVPQDPAVFAGTLVSNLVYGAPPVDQARLERVTRSAGLGQFMARVRDGYLAPVGARGRRLSGGERQRVALARALMRGAPILLLDEATSALDSETEAGIYGELSLRASTCTTIIVAHRLASIAGVDRIVVMADGRIVESGSPEQLLVPGTRCHALFAAQLAGPEQMTFVAPTTACAA